MIRPLGDPVLLAQFEAGLDPRRPGSGPIRAHVLGYGEASTVLTLGPDGSSLAYKRLPMFRSAEEANLYEDLHRRYVRALRERAGVHVTPTNTLQVINERPQRTVVYLIQELLPSESLCHKVIFKLPPDDVTRLVMAILQETARVFDLNQVRPGEMELGFDADISNWAIADYQAEEGRLPEKFKLTYFDTSTPMMRYHGQEQLDLEMFLRGTPAPVLPLIRRTILPDIVARYYEFRRVAVDLLSQFYRLGREGFVSANVDSANWYFLAERREPHFQPIREEEIKRYDRRDSMLRKGHLWLRRFSRAMHRASGRDYPYILPRTGAW